MTEIGIPGIRIERNNERDSCDCRYNEDIGNVDFCETLQKEFSVLQGPAQVGQIQSETRCEKKSMNSCAPKINCLRLKAGDREILWK